MKRRQAESALGASLPADTASVDFHRWRPAPGIDYAVVYVRLRLGREAGLAFRDRLGLRTAEDPAARVSLATGWHTAPEGAPSWWPREPARTLTGQAARATDAGGWIVAGYSAPYLYVLVNETRPTPVADPRR
ncbi:hypothetical protein [Amycolatopsis sp. cmx-4-68]|uniref:hypothetical protein n=1 Tax=Amycolatopsis sp. cmx-4-68 TaxID=2790938 RepID=UPI0039794EDD